MELRGSSPRQECVCPRSGQLSSAPARRSHGQAWRDNCLAAPHQYSGQVDHLWSSGNPRTGRRTDRFIGAVHNGRAGFWWWRDSRCECHCRSDRGRRWQPICARIDSGHRARQQPLIPRPGPLFGNRFGTVAAVEIGASTSPRLLHLLYLPSDHHPTTNSNDQCNCDSDT
jgi:hypothetical protein